MDNIEFMAWDEQLHYWEEKRDLVKTQQEYWNLKLEMTKRKYEAGD